jgi:LacI family transcriptional regulator
MTERGRVRIDDVAEAAGVHKATVSRALNEATQGQVSAETVRRVRRAARQLGYVPNVMARGLRTSSSMSIGVIIPDLMNPIFPPLIRGIENFLQPRGYTALLANTDGHDAVEESAFRSLQQRRVDGYILATGTLGGQDFLARAHEEGAFVVLVNRGSGTDLYPVVAGSNASGMTSAVAHVVDLGHRHILHLAGPANFSTSKERADAFALATARRGLHPETVEAGALTIEAGQAAMDAVLARGVDRPTAVLAGNDMVALGVMRSLREHGLRCPDDVSVVGFNDMPFAEDFSPPLTTVHMPLREIGAEAARLLLAGIAARSQDPVHVTLPVALVVRASTAAAPR